MGGHSAGTPEAGRIINGGFEGQRCDWSDTGNRHHPHANFVLNCSALDPPVKFQKMLIQDHPGVQKRHQGMRQNLIHLDQRSDNTIETAPPQR